MGDEPLHHAKDRRAWRRWLDRNHRAGEAVHLVFYRKGTGKASVTYEEAVEEAVCFGWIDGVKRKLDDERYTLRFSPRRPTSKWSESNRRRVAKLEKEGRLTPAGLAAVREAKKRGTWNPGPRASGAQTPAELDAALARSSKARAAYDSLPPSHRKQWNQWVGEAKREETRERRAARELGAGSRRPTA